MTGKPLYFVHISDTHLGPTRDFDLYGSNCFDNAVRVVEAINQLPTKPDFVVHTGDVVSHPDEASYRLAEEVFSTLNSPVYFVNGNHDSAPYIHTHLSLGEKTNATNDFHLLSYSFEKKGYRSVVLDARGPDEIDPHGVLGEVTLSFLHQEINKDEAKIVVFIHFPPLRLDSLWLDEEMLLLNGELLHQALLPVRERICGVFFGHVHRGIQMMVDGILYSSVASTSVQFCAWPGEAKAQFDLVHPPSYNFVTLVEGKTIIKEHTISQLRI